MLFKKELKNSMHILSSAFGNNQTIPDKYTCNGADINPPLSFVEVPILAKSLVLIVDDPDASRGDWVHWLIWNLSPDTKEIRENYVPAEGVLGMTDFGKRDYGGPCPPSGVHRYQFKLFALDVTLELPESTGKNDLEKFMQGHILEQTILVGLYKR